MCTDFVPNKGYIAKLRTAWQENFSYRLVELGMMHIFCGRYETL